MGTDVQINGLNVLQAMNVFNMMLSVMELMTV